ncbi:SRPBCC domain-containing protein [Mesonia sp. K7]|uniref:SRPBCC domain-containing protein n=1 Tax=Mesonia sp. K7 TaxID=2218606 RepID=UPI000DA87C17|nr:SRPBCC domain-containing protein [Mesonia sp. K7]PZD76540.1 hypothetical protein DNG35_11600 [Mesonia sp. K7]
MKSSLLFNFSVNKENKTIHIQREFNADLKMIWKAWTEPELLNQWWAPKPYHIETKTLNLEVGGMWLYAMVSPENEKTWCKADYKAIETNKRLSWLDAFCDENGQENTLKPRSLWTNIFTAKEEVTQVDITLKHDKLEDIEAMINMGFKEGFEMALANLDHYIESQFRLRQQNKTHDRARVSTYLNFPGNTEEAFIFYKQVFQSDFVNGIQRFDEVPADHDHPPMNESVKKMVLHVELPILGGHILMGTDAPKEFGMSVNTGNNMHINLEPESREEAKRLFDALSEDGRIEMPIKDMFWGAYFGSCTDKFGINWMVNYQIKSSS